MVKKLLIFLEMGLECVRSAHQSWVPKIIVLRTPCALETALESARFAMSTMCTVHTVDTVCAVGTLCTLPLARGSALLNVRSLSRTLLVQEKQQHASRRSLDKRRHKTAGNIADGLRCSPWI